MTTSLDYLRQTGTVLVCDSGDFECESAPSGFSIDFCCSSWCSYWWIQPSGYLDLLVHWFVNLYSLKLCRILQQILLWSWLLLVFPSTAVWLMLPLSTENRRVEVLRNKLIMRLTASYDFYPLGLMGVTIKFYFTSLLSLAKKFLLLSLDVFPPRSMPVFHSTRKQQRPRYNTRGLCSRISFHFHSLFL